MRHEPVRQGRAHARVVSVKTELQAHLEGEVMEVEWDALAPHYARGAVIQVSGALPIVQVAMAFGLDAKDDVEAWLRDGLVSKPTDDDARAWSEGARFRFLIVQPFVLVQRIEEG